MNANLTAATEADLLRGINWFEKIVPGLGDQFESSFRLIQRKSTPFLPGAMMLRKETENVTYITFN